MRNAATSVMAYLTLHGVPIRLGLRVAGERPIRLGLSPATRLPTWDLLLFVARCPPAAATWGLVAFYFYHNG